MRRAPNTIFYRLADRLLGSPIGLATCTYATCHAAYCVAAYSPVGRDTIAEIMKDRHENQYKSIIGMIFAERMLIPSEDKKVDTYFMPPVIQESYQETKDERRESGAYENYTRLWRDSPIYERFYGGDDDESD
eukprot:216463_1